jgi:hypothetical protein
MPWPPTRLWLIIKAMLLFFIDLESHSERIPRRFAVAATPVVLYAVVVVVLRS